MKKQVIAISVIALLLLMIYTCKKEDSIALPTVVTASVDSIKNTSARVGGNVASDGGDKISERGVYWGTSTSPETSGVKLQIGSGTGAFYNTLTGLVSGVKYYVRSYAINSKGASYGGETFFTTQISKPIVSTSEITEYTSSSAEIGGNVSDDGGNEVTQRGVYWGVYQNPVLTGTKLVIGSGKGEFSQNLTGLSRYITYYIVAFATNIKGTSYGSQIGFTTSPESPTISTSEAYNITTYTAAIGGKITSNGGVSVTERGVYWGVSSNPELTGTKLVIGSGDGVFADTIVSLTPATTYHFKAYAVNSVGTSYGDERTFTTLGKLPEVTTLKANEITSNSATLSGIIYSNYLSTAVSFEYGTTTSYGSTVTALGSPTTNDDDTLSASITGLSPFTTYHFRVVATNDLGTTYGADSTFTTVVTGITGTVADYDGNNYNTIGVGYLYWMTSNLRTTRYNDGTSIPSAEKDSLWNTLTTPAYCWYNNDSTSNASIYGGLYNWYTVNTGKLCPSGWRLPTNDEITDLINYLGTDAGGLLKETGTSYWNSPNTGATNSYGFNARAGGKRSDEGVYDYVKVDGDWWTSSDYSTLTASYFYILYNYSNLFQATMSKKYGMSVRCVKN